jgi:hypothetical protein
MRNERMNSNELYGIPDTGMPSDTFPPIAELLPPRQPFNPLYGLNMYFRMQLGFPTGGGVRLLAEANTFHKQTPELGLLGDEAPDGMYTPDRIAGCMRGTQPLQRVETEQQKRPRKTATGGGGGDDYAERMKKILEDAEAAGGWEGGPPQQSVRGRYGTFEEALNAANEARQFVPSDEEEPGVIYDFEPVYNPETGMYEVSMKRVLTGEDESPFVQDSVDLKWRQKTRKGRRARMDEVLGKQTDSFETPTEESNTTKEESKGQIIHFSDPDDPWQDFNF